jgi:hypothetical protein
VTASGEVVPGSLMVASSRSSPEGASDVSSVGKGKRARRARPSSWLWVGK